MLLPACQVRSGDLQSPNSSHRLLLPTTPRFQGPPGLGLGLLSSGKKDDHRAARRLVQYSTVGRVKACTSHVWDSNPSSHIILFQLYTSNYRNSTDSCWSWKASFAPRRGLPIKTHAPYRLNLELTTGSLTVEASSCTNAIAAGDRSGGRVGSQPRFICRLPEISCNIPQTQSYRPKRRRWRLLSVARFDR